MYLAAGRFGGGVGPAVQFLDLDGKFVKVMNSIPSMLLSEAVLNGTLGSQLVDGLHLSVDVSITPCMMPYEETSRVGMLP